MNPRDTTTKTKTAELLDDGLRVAQPLAKVDHEGAARDGDATEGVLRMLEQRNQFIERILKYALGATDEGHWTDLGGKPWLTAPGAEAVARRCAVNMTETKYRKIETEDENGPYFYFIYEGTFRFANSPYDVMEGAIGTCSSRDRFLATDAQDDLEGALLKAARSNCKVNGVCELLGIRGMTFDRLAKYGVNLDVNKISKVEYKHGAKGGGGAGKTFTFPWGEKTKGKRPDEVTDRDLTYFKGAFEKSIADPDPSKAKYKRSNQEGLDAVNAEIERRKNPAPKEQPGAAGASGPAPAANPNWLKIKLVCEKAGVPEKDLGALVQTATGKGKPADLIPEDVVKVERYLAPTQHDGPEDEFANDLTEEDVR